MQTLVLSLHNIWSVNKYLDMFFNMESKQYINKTLFEQFSEKSNCKCYILRFTFATNNLNQYFFPYYKFANQESVVNKIHTSCYHTKKKKKLFKFLTISTI